MSMHLQAGWVARRWHSLVGVRWQRFAAFVTWRCVGQARQSVAFWRAAGCPPAFVPRRALRRLALVWWLRVVLVVALVLLGPFLLALLLS